MNYEQLLFNESFRATHKWVTGKLIGLKQLIHSLTKPVRDVTELKSDSITQTEPQVITYGHIYVLVRLK